MKYLSIDLETTGIDFDCDLLEFGAVLDDLDNPLPLEELPVYHVYFQRSKYYGEPKALSMHKEIFLKIADKKKEHTYLNAEKFGNHFKKFLLDKGYTETNNLVYINVAGKNFNSFDLQFLRNKSDFSKHIRASAKVLDPAILYYQKGDTQLPGLSLCLRRAGFEGNVKHCAVDDALDVVRLIRAKLL